MITGNKALIASLLSILGLGVNAQDTSTVSDDFTRGGYKLVWADEFNKEGKPDPANWGFEQGFVRNNELQWYQPQNASCKRGKLIIEVREENRKNPDFKAESKNWRENRQMIEYTSSSLNTRDKHSWKYGRFVMRGKIDVGPGLWPAFWTLGVRGEWPSNGEIDIMEYYKGEILANIAIGTDKRYTAKWYSKTRPLEAFDDPEWADKFHIWRMDWDENAISLFVDDELLNRVEMKNLINLDGSNVNPFRQAHYMLLNFAIGGDNGGDLLDTKLPKRFEIDYVRVYQR